MDNKKIIVFDMDGVLIDSIPVMFELSSNRYPGLEFTEFQNMFTGNIHSQIEVFKEKYKNHLKDEEQQKIFLDNYTQKKTTTVILYPEIRELLEELKERGYRLAINSSASANNTLPILERLGITDYFEKILLKDDSHSKVDKFKILKEYFGCEYPEILFITDSVGDVKEAAELTIPTIAVTWGVHTMDHFSEVSNNLIGMVHSVKELQKLISK